jgi:hypothetical protein
VPNPNSGDAAVFDARVGGGFPVTRRTTCSRDACQGAPTPARVLPVAASVDFTGQGNVEQARSSNTAKLAVSKVKTIRGTSGSLKVRVPRKGRLTVSGSAVRTKRSIASKAQTLAVRLALTSGAAKALRRQRVLRSKVKVAFTDGRGHTSTVTLSLTFKTTSTRKGL